MCMRLQYQGRGGGSLLSFVSRARWGSTRTELCVGYSSPGGAGTIWASVAWASEGILLVVRVISQGQQVLLSSGIEPARAEAQCFCANRLNHTATGVRVGMAAVRYYLGITGTGPSSPHPGVDTG
eukprot:scaffold92078_cov59-Phaeocystis_antarctica.AAC.2